MPISQSTASSRRTGVVLRSVTSWAKRCAAYHYFHVELVAISHLQIVRHVNMLDGVAVSESKAQKDEIILEGNDIDNVSQSGNLYHPVFQLYLTIFSSCIYSRCLPCPQ